MARLFPPPAACLMAGCALLLAVGCSDLGETVVVGANAESSSESTDSDPSDPSEPADTGDESQPDDSTDPADGSDTDVALSESACIFFVSASANPSGDGTSWPDATSDLNGAILQGRANLESEVCDAIEVRLTAGTYRPSAQDRSVSFTLYHGLTLRGGYTGNDTQPDARNLQTEETILSGDIGLEGDSADNSYHVIIFVNVPTAEAHLDGIIIEAGYADGEGDDQDGAGLRVETAHIRLTDTRIRSNHALGSGGGMYLLDGQVSENRTTWSSNNAEDNGGAIYAENARAYPYDVLFTENEAHRGGALYLQSSPDWHIQYGVLSLNRATDRGGAIFDSQSIQLRLCRATFQGNEAGVTGGAVFSNLSTSVQMASSVWIRNTAPTGASITMLDVGEATLSNLTLTKNTPASDGFNLAVEGMGTHQIANAILWQNGSEYHPDSPLVIAHSIVPEDYEPGETNLGEDPLFMNPPENTLGITDLSLRPDSPAIDSGSNDAVAQDFCGNDAANSPRVINGLVDRGAYESGI